MPHRILGSVPVHLTSRSRVLLCRMKVRCGEESTRKTVVARGLVKEDLLDIRAGVKAGRYVKEATVSQGIVQQLLNSLGWPVYDTEIVAPEYSLGTRRADYALCHPPREPVILIEVKQVGLGTGDESGELVEGIERVPCRRC